MALDRRRRVLRRFREAALAGDRVGGGVDATSAASSPTSGAPRRASRNQGWKDSDEAIRHADGRLARAADRDGRGAGVPLPRAAAARRDPRRARRAEGAADCPRSSGRGSSAAGTTPSGCRARASTRWPSTPTVSRLQSITSNPGHALGGGHCPAASTPDVADRLLSPSSSAAGACGRSREDHPSYNPLAYHLGSVWPVENATFALGLKRYGLDDHLERLASALLEAAALTGGPPAGGASRGIAACPSVRPDALPERLLAPGVVGVARWSRRSS